MALSVAQICNIALSRIGITLIISDIDEGSAEATACKTLFDPLRDALLAAFPWPFANRRFTLNLIEEEPTDEWAYSYRLPADFLSIRRIENSYQIQGSTEVVAWTSDSDNFIKRNADRVSGSVPFKIAGDATGQILYCDINPATIEYTTRVTDNGLLPTDFGMLMAWNLAAELAPALARNDGSADRARAGYEREFLRLKAHYINQASLDAPMDAEAIQERE
jgi:hypothetical protein